MRNFDFEEAYNNCPPFEEALGPLVDEEGNCSEELLDYCAFLFEIFDTQQCDHLLKLNALYREYILRSSRYYFYKGAEAYSDFCN